MTDNPHERIRKLTDEEIHSARPNLEELSCMKRFPVSIVLENIRSLYNVGSMFRTADGAGIEKLYICGYTGYPPRKEIAKTALGAVDSVPWERCPNTFEVIYRLRAQGYQIVSLEHTDKSVTYTEADYNYPVCLVLGNEVKGVTPEIVAESDMAVDIPMFGIKQSLNVSVACGIALYRIVDKCRQMLEK